MQERAKKSAPCGRVYMVLLRPSEPLAMNLKGIVSFPGFPKVLPQTNFEDVYPGLMHFVVLLRTTPVQPDEAVVDGIPPMLPPSSLRIP